jgi:hypothetical protein
MIAFLMLVGPGEAEMALDTLYHCLRLYPDASAFVREDATTDGTFDKLAGFATEHAPRVSLERNSQPEGYFGVAVSTFRAYDSLWNSHSDLEMIIELDPDTCVLRPGLVELARKRFAEHGPGIIGSYRISPSGGKRDFTPHRLSILRDLIPVGTDQKTKRRRLGFPFYMKYLPRAFLNGYQPGENVLAAFYILHGDTFRELGRRGFWRSTPPEGSRYLKMDDPLISLGAKYAGHKLIEMNQPGEISAWVQYKPPIPLTAEEIVEKGYMAVHPVKSNEEGKRLRRELRSLLA